MENVFKKVLNMPIFANYLLYFSTGLTSVVNSSLRIGSIIIRTLKLVFYSISVYPRSFKINIFSLL